jgi:hypothetical protein
LDDTPDLVDGITIEKTGKELNANGETNLTGVFGCNISIAN